MNREVFEAKLIAKANADEAFRKALLADPKGTLQKELQDVKSGFSLPANLKVTVVEESSDHIYLRLPIQRGPALSEADLAGVSGGAGKSPAVAQAITIDVTAAVAIDVTATAVTTAVVVGPGNIVVT